MKPNDGGPAFPALHFDLAENEHGMSLRDYFAAKAMAALIVAPMKEWPNDLERGDRAGVSTAAYEIADAMLKAREA